MLERKVLVGEEEQKDLPFLSVLNLVVIHCDEGVIIVCTCELIASHMRVRNTHSPRVV